MLLKQQCCHLCEGDRGDSGLRLALGVKLQIYCIFCSDNVFVTFQIA